jgi:hypothetical protein
MAQNIAVVIVDKTGTLKITNIKDYKEEELYKKCSFKKPDDFSKQTEWSVKIDGSKYKIALFAKTEGKANTENKYDFPPPVDTTLYFGSCVLVGKSTGPNGSETLVSLTLELWNKIYEKLFGGFENLDATCAEDEEEEDELANVPAEKKTKQGYLKDGFVVDSDDDDDSDEENSSYEDDDDSEEESDPQDGEDSQLLVEDIGSELSSEEYEYSDEDDKIPPQKM